MKRRHILIYNLWILENIKSLGMLFPEGEGGDECGNECGYEANDEGSELLL